MVLNDWLSSFRGSLSGRVRRSWRRKMKRLQKQEQAASRSEHLEARTLLTGPQVVSVLPNVGGALTANEIRTEAPNEITIVFGDGQNIDPTSLNGIKVTRATDGLFGNANDVSYSPTATTPSLYVGLGDQANKVVLRFADNLPQDNYRIFIPGSGALALKDTFGNALNNGTNFSLDFQLNLGPQVTSVVPQPVVRNPNGTLTWQQNQVDVYFSEAMGAAASNPVNYQLIDTTTGAIRLPASVSYNAAEFKASLTFSSIPAGTWRLEVGSNVEPNNTLTTAINAGRIFTANDFVLNAQLGDVNGVNDVDLYRFEMSKAGTAVVTVVPQSATLNTYLMVFNEQGQVVPYTVLGGVAGDPDKVIVNAPGQGVYYVGVTSFGNWAYNVNTGGNALGGTGVGGYTIRIQTNIQLYTGNDDNSSYGTATPLGNLGGSQTFNAVIQPQTQVQFPLPPGGIDEPGHRDIPPSPESHIGSSGNGTYTPNAIGVVDYYFGTNYGTDPQGNTLNNAITPEQKQRTREIMELYSRIAGIQFRETAGSGLQIITGDPRALDPTIPTGIGGLAGGGKAIMNGAVNWGDSEYGGGWMHTAFHEIGHLLGLGHSYDLPSLNGGNFDDPLKNETLGDGKPDVEDSFPGDVDIVHMQRLYPSDGSDIDLYKFNLTEKGTFSAEITAERAGSYLNSVLTLYKETVVSGKTVRTVIAQNDDYFGNDSFVNLELDAGTYYIGVSAQGNSTFDPIISDTGYGGRSDGNYSLKIKHVPTPRIGLSDSTGRLLDGNFDGKSGDSYNFWFQTGNTIFVDKNAVGKPGQNGSITNPYGKVSDALALMPSNTAVLRLVGNNGADGNILTPADAKAYLFGKSNGVTLEDGEFLNVPKNVTVMIDAGAVLKFNNSMVNVGSFIEDNDRSGGALQVLGTPKTKVYFTSFKDDTLGGDANGDSPVEAVPSQGDWGGIAFRKDSDRDGAGIFLNSVNQAQFTYGGGKVVLNSNEQAYTPIHLIESRPAITNNVIMKNATAAISADPNSFRETIDRIGPEIHGNKVTDNSLNALLVRISTNPGAPIETLDVSARFNETDISYVIPENLFINGNPGGNFGSTVRQAGRLMIDPGAIVKLNGSRIEATVGSSQLIAEGTTERPIIFTSLSDDRYGAGGEFDANEDGATTGQQSDWGGLIFLGNSSASLDHVVITYAGGATPIEGGFDKFNAIEIHQANVRIANSVLENNASGDAAGNRNGRGSNTNTVIFVRGAQPVIVNNIIRNNGTDETDLTKAISINANSMVDNVMKDYGRTTGSSDRFTQFDANFGPLVRLNRLADNQFDAMEVRAEEVLTGSVWDDTDIVHYVNDEIKLTENFHTDGGLRLQSNPGESLVVKLRGQNAGFTADGDPIEIDDRIGGSFQILGRPGYPVILTALSDDSVGAGFRPDGTPNRDTENNGDVAIVTDGRLPTGPEVNNGTLIDNDAATTTIGFFTVQPQNGGQWGQFVNGENRISIKGKNQDYIDVADFIAEYFNYIDVGDAGSGVNLSNTTITTQAALVSDDLVASEGTFQGENGLVQWRIETSFEDGSPRMVNKLVLTGENGTALGRIRFMNFLHSHPTGDDDAEIFYLSGTPGAADFRLNILDQEDLAGYSQGGFYVAGPELQNATYAGFAADTWDQASFDITGTGGSYSIPGVINTTAFPAYNDPELGLVYGPNDPGTVLAWDVNPTATTATITSFLELFSEGIAPSLAGEWRGIKIGEHANYRNVAIVNEQEALLTAGIEQNGTINTAQNLGLLAKNTNSGDDFLRLGYQVNGFISPDSPGDADVYSFQAQAGTEVWLDVDQSASNVDLVLDLIKSDGIAFARSLESQGSQLNPILATPNLNELSTQVPSNGAADDKVFPMTKDPTDGGDFFGVNRRDPGMRVILPGTPGTVNTYFVRVRSQAGTTEQYLANKKSVDLANPKGGVTSGYYEMQIRLRQVDEIAGSTIQYADIRNATNGVEVLGGPSRSPLTGETGEGGEASNLLANAQPIGNLLASDRNTISVAGNLSNFGDVDFYRLDIDYQQIQSIGGVNDSGKTWATVFDIDYADGLARPDTTISVFNSQGQLIFIGRDSNIEDDQPAPNQGTDVDDLSRGSVGKHDAYIGSAQISEGTYYVAISTKGQRPTAVSATFDSANDSTARLEPISGVQRIVEDHIGYDGYRSGNGAIGYSNVSSSTGQILPINSSLALSTTVQAFTLGDVELYVSRPGHLYSVNAFTGGLVRDIGDLEDSASDTSDIVMRSDGRLFAYGGLPNDDGNAGALNQLNPASGAIVGTQLDEIADATLITNSVGAVAIRRNPGNVANYTPFYAVDDPVASMSMLFQANPTTGSTAADPNDLEVGPKGPITGAGISGFTRGMAFLNGVLYGVSDNGQFYSINVTTGAATLIANRGIQFSGLANGPQNAGGGAYRNLLFATDTQGRLYALNASGVLQAIFTGGATSITTGLSGATGLAFSPLDFNLWHPTENRGGEAGHGVNAAPDNSRDGGFNVSVNGRPGTNQSQGGASFYFGLEQWQENPNAARTYFTYDGQNAQYGMTTQTHRDLVQGAGVAGTYDIFGIAAKGALVTNTFDLSGYSRGDKPTLYFNYFLETEGAAAGVGANTMRDSARVYVTTDNGATWTLVATNNSTRSPSGSDAGELPPSDSDTSDSSTRTNQVTQELFDTASWRQARIDLGQFAGQGNIKLRFEFSTAGTMGQNLKGDIYGNAAEGYDNNQFEGFYIDDIIVGFAERGEMVTGAAIDSTFTTVPPDASGSNFSDYLSGTYQLEIRRGTEFGFQPQLSNSGIHVSSYNTNVRLTQSPLTIGDATLYVTRGNRLLGVNPFTGQVTGGNFGSIDQSPNSVGDLANLPNGTLLAYSGIFGDAGNAGRLITLNQLTGSQLSSVNDGIVSGTLNSDAVGAVAVLEDTNSNVIPYYAVDNPVTSQSVLFKATAGGSAAINGGDPSIGLKGIISGAGVTGFTRGMAFIDGVLYGVSSTGAFYTINRETGAATLITQFPASINFSGLSAGPPTSNNGAYKKLLFAIDTNGKLYAFNTSGVLQPVFNGGVTSINTGLSGATGLAFSTLSLLGDQNLVREQDTFQILNSKFSSNLENGIKVTGTRDVDTNASYPGTARNLPVLNGSGLVPGVLIANNVFYSNDQAAISVEGDSTAGDVPTATKAFAKIVNNTIYGADTADGTGIRVSTNSAPTILNNIIANTVTGIEVDSTSSGNTVIGTTVFQGNTVNLTGASATNTISLAATDPLFVDPVNRNFYLAAGSKAIDSSLNTLEDRPSQVAVKNGVGLPPAPILVPDRDIFGVARADDPTVTSPPGLGANIFKDRGAIERIDRVAPTVALVNPVDNDANDKDPTTTVVVSHNPVLSQLVLQFNDNSTGIDGTKVISSNFTLTRNGTTLTEGDDGQYVFSYNPATKQVFFTFIETISDDYVYELTLNRDNLQDIAGNKLTANRANGTTAFTIVALNGKNDAPVNTVPGTQSVPEDTLLKFSTATGNAISISDVDAIYGNNQARVTLSVINGIMTLGTKAGLTFQTGDGSSDKTMTFTGTIPAINAALQGLLYRGNANFNGSDALTITTNDLGNHTFPAGPANIVTNVIPINVTSVNDAPVLDDTGVMTLTSIKENGFENPGNLISDIILSAGGNRITDVDASPLEGIAIHGVNNTYGQWQYSLSNGSSWNNITGVNSTNALLLGWNGSTRIRFVPNDGFSGTSGISFAAWDQTSGSNGAFASLATRGGSTAFSLKNESATITVTPIPHAITITNLGPKVTFTEKGPAVLVADAAIVTDSQAPVFGGGRFTATLTANATADDRLTIRHQGTGSGQIGVSGANVSFGGTVFGVITGGVGTTPLNVNFNASATQAAVQALVRNLTFSVLGGTPSTLNRAIELKLRDAGGDTSLPVYKNLGVNSVNDPPTIQADTSTDVNYVVGLSPAVILPAAVVTDPDSPTFPGGSLTVESTGASGNDLLSIQNVGSGTGQISVFGQDVFYAGTKIGSFTGGSGSAPLVVSLTAGATGPGVQQLIRNVIFSTTSSSVANGARSVKFTFNDGAGGSSSVTRTVRVFGGTGGSSAQLAGGTEAGTQQAPLSSQMAAANGGSSSSSTSGESSTATLTAGATTKKAAKKASKPTKEIDAVFSFLGGDFLS